MERDVVLADEVERARRRIIPPVAPRLWVAAVLGPLDGGREVADDRLEPDVEHLVVVALVHGHRDAPIHVAGHGPADQAAVDEVARKVDDLRPPMFLVVVDPLGQRILGDGRQVEEEVLCVA